MPRWQYFIAKRPRDVEMDPLRVRFARRDLDGPSHNCQTIQRPGVWGPSDFLERYYILGSNDEDIIDLTPEQMVDLITRAVQAGRFKEAPVDPALLVQ